MPVQKEERVPPFSFQILYIITSIRIQDYENAGTNDPAMADLFARVEVS